MMLRLTWLIDLLLCSAALAWLLASSGGGYA